MNDGTSLFFKIFGASIFGALCLLLITVLNHLNSNNDIIRSEMTKAVSDLRVEINKISIVDISNLREKVAGISSSKDAIKEQITQIESVAKEPKEKIIALEQAINGLKDKQNDLQKEITELKLLLIENKK